MLAARGGCTEIVEALIESDADILSLRNKVGYWK